jgi:hypothetical protein
MEFKQNGQSCGLSAVSVQAHQWRCGRGTSGSDSYTQYFVWKRLSEKRWLIGESAIRQMSKISGSYYLLSVAVDISLVLIFATPCNHCLHWHYTHWISTFCCHYFTPYHQKSNGLLGSFIVLTGTQWVYIMVVFRLEWPSRFWMTRIS